MRLMTQSAESQPSPDGAERTRLVDVLGAFSLAGDLAVGMRPEHGARSCYIGMQIGQRLGLPVADQRVLFYTELLKDAGCTAYTSQLAALWLVDELTAKRDLQFLRDATNPLQVMSWVAQYVAAGAPLGTRAAHIFEFLKSGRAAMREGFESTCQMASRIAERLAMPDAVPRALMYVFEQWDGKGMPDGARHEDIPLVSRIVLLTSYLEVFHGVGGREAAERLARARRGKAFDPESVDAFLAVAANDGFWAGLDDERLWDRVLALEPQGSRDEQLPASRLTDVAFAFADYADMKAPYLAGHSRRVAELAERIGRRLALPEERLGTLFRAGLVYDVGLVAVPSFVLAKPGARMTEIEREQYRMHPYHSQRILARIPAFAALMPTVAAHHERLDARGYPGALGAAQINVDARILAVADRFEALTHDTPEGVAMEAKQAAETLRAESGMALAPDVVEALIAELHLAASTPRRAGARLEWPAGLTDREAEVLRLVAAGRSRREAADALVVSEGTIRSHLEHIYSKIGVSNRAGATLFAMEHGLLS
jgi:HD-GYP domain-containing protein (c-di-GMP phosphodiesterase class II)/DNA-binding CsgD family transcriptional regulator